MKVDGGGVPSPKLPLDNIDTSVYNTKVSKADNGDRL
jgi:hypothetical protein